MENGAIIVTYADSFTIDLSGLISIGQPFDRKFARIKYSEIRSLAMENNTTSIEIVFSNSEIKSMNYQHLDTLDGVAVTSQVDFYNKLDAKLFIVAAPQ